MSTSNNESTAEKLRVGTFNVEFLFDGVKDPSFATFSKSPATAQQHLDSISEIVKKIKPDIMNLAEVENKEVLDRLAESVGSDIAGYFVEGTDTYTKQDVALLSRFPPEEMYRTDERAEFPLEGSQCNSREDDTAVSKNYIAKFDDPRLFPFKFAIIGAHLKAIPNRSSACAKREGQAVVLQRAAVQLLDEGYELMIMGDLNDFSEKSEDVNMNVPTSRVLAMLRDPNNDNEDELKNVMDLIPLEDRFTAVYDRNGNKKLDGKHELSQIDHILLTDRLWKRVTRAWVDQHHDPFAVSDHWPLMVELRRNLEESME